MGKHVRILMVRPYLVMDVSQMVHKVFVTVDVQILEVVLHVALLHLADILSIMGFFMSCKNLETL